MSFTVLDHTSIPKAVLIEIGRVLKPCGWLILYTDLRTEAQTGSLHPTAFSKSWVLDMLSSLGFISLETHTLPVGRSMEVPTLWGVFQKEFPGADEVRPLPDVNRMWWLHCPMRSHEIQRFRVDERLYVTDVEVGKVLEIDEVIWDVIEYCDSATNDEIVATLSEKYSEDEIYAAFEALGEAQREGLLFPMEAEQTSPVSPGLSEANVMPQRRKIFAPMASETLIRLAHSKDAISSRGALTTAADMLYAMAQQVDLVTLSKIRGRLADGIYGIPFSTSQESLDIPLHILHHEYDGIYLVSPPGQKQEYRSFLPLFHLDIPVVYHLSSPEALSEEGIHNVLLMYAFMREFDAFCISTESVKEFYSKLIFDSDCFYVVPDGVDVEHFHPMNKEWAKLELASFLSQKPVVGFVGPFQPERGSRIFLKLACLNPDFLFLAISPELDSAILDIMPENFIHADEPSVKIAPLFLNALDVCCLPVMCEEERFNLTLLPAMACGIPAIVPRVRNFSAIIGDAGILVESEYFENDIADFKNSGCIFLFSEAIQKLISDQEMNKRLSFLSRKRALSFTVQKAAQSILDLFFELNERKYLISEISQKDRSLRALVSSASEEDFHPSVFSTSIRTIEGIACALLKRHTLHEVEAVLRQICPISAEGVGHASHAKEIAKIINQLQIRLFCEEKQRATTVC